ncbi:XRE family transcriptional regulator [Nocardia sp. IBHARD005]|uniref:XRE family transcriptional regulator n=1 Tax=Nocardia sp. IBHARD005 TaxID=3457765 RepID=UPI00405A2AAE
MSRPARTPRIKHRPGELQAARARLIEFMQAAVGHSLTAQLAEDLLVEAKAWNGQGAYPLSEHLDDHPDAFIAPSPHSPAHLFRVLKLLDANGFGEAITLLGCARCGRTDLALDRLAPEGRCCAWCVGRTELRRCARCHTDGHPGARRPEGVICRRCYRKDPEFLAECGRCGRVRAPASRVDDGTARCQTCYGRPQKACSHCGKVGPPHANTAKGPVCRNCHQSPARLCGICGQMGQIQRRGDGEGRPDICRACYRNIGDCVVCGRRRAGGKFRGGPFHCNTCAPRTPRDCAICARPGIIRAIWPVGDVCRSCWELRTRYPEPCSDCGNRRVLVAVATTGNICARCAGSDLDYACRTCGEDGRGYIDGSCEQCVVIDQVNTMLSGPDGVPIPALQPLAQALIAANPGTVLGWLKRRASSQMLADLVANDAAITHEALDELPQGNKTFYIRGLLVSTGVLPHRNEPLAQLALWSGRTAAQLPPHHQRLIAPYAEWHVVRRARRRAARGPFRRGAAVAARARIRAAIKLLNWLDTAGIDPHDLNQHHIDEWFDAEPSQRHRVVGFLVWLKQRRLIGEIEIPRRKYALPQRFMVREDFDEQLRRCLTDNTLPLDLRVAGALIRLYGLPLVRIVELTTDRFSQDGDDAHLIIDKNSVVVPPSLAFLIDQLIRTGGPDTMVPATSVGTPTFLFPGRPANRPRSVSQLAKSLSDHQLPTIAARNSAMLANITDMDAVVVSDLFGVSPSTAHGWARLAQTSWAEYLAHATADRQFAEPTTAVLR